ncbi:MAG: hypothetical protein IPN74_00385 [Haliscomenobacter sp.]|nr:hypothetical protein [Haliscomenobacter sp.]MBK8877054.1 hypothetical protein [Haliscomenobacter sp.]
MTLFRSPIFGKRASRNIRWGLILAFVPSCAWLDPEDPIPAYLQVEPFVLQTDSRSQGSASATITEAWLKINGEFLGVYGLPADIPLLEAAGGTISLEAGIKENGIGATPEIYPFYQPFTLKAVLAPQQPQKVEPLIRYRPETRFSLLEGFENSGHLFQSLVSGKESGRIQISASDVFEGNASGLILLNADNPAVELATTSRYSGLTARGAFVYLEVNYRSDVPVRFGVISTPKGGGSSTIQYVAGFNPSETWKKIYFNLSPAFSGSTLEDYQIILGAAIPLKTDGTLSRTNARILLDNLKLVHF